MRPVKWMSGRRSVLRVIAFLGVVCVVQLAVGAFVVYWLAVAQTRSFINGISERAKEDISFTNGMWDTSKYDVDPEIPGPYRMYVITKDGFVIDRWRPIAGYLDTSDLKQLLLYKTPTTVETVTGQNWRIVSLPLSDGRGVVGAVTVGSFGVDGDTDDLLRQVASELAAKVKIEGGAINTDGINVRNVPFTVSFQVVDQYNRIHLKSNNANSVDRLPNYIDPSYITHELQKPTVRTIADSSGAENFLVQSTPLIDDGGSPLGTLIVARTISPHLELARHYLWVGALVSTFVIGGATYVAHRLRKMRSRDKAKATSDQRLTNETITSIMFNKSSCSIIINNEHVVEFSFATNQYYLCTALFGQPKKKWETDELLERFGEDAITDAWRKIYDAMASINKKSAVFIRPKLIVVSNKTYQINPELVPKVIKKS